MLALNFKSSFILKDETTPMLRLLLSLIWPPAQQTLRALTNKDAIIAHKGSSDEETTFFFFGREAPFLLFQFVRFF